MPSLAFWKNAKQPEAAPPAAASEEKKVEQDAPVKQAAFGSLDFNPGDQESGVFSLDENGELVLVPKAVDSTPTKNLDFQPVERHGEGSAETRVEEQPSEEITVVETITKTSTTPTLVEAAPKQPKRDSAFSEPSDDGYLPNQQTPSSSDVMDAPSPQSVSSLSAKPMSTHSTTDMTKRDSTPRRLHRPTELNLSTSPGGVKPKTELEKRFDLMRNSKSQSKAALRSPTALLHDRLNLSPKKVNSHKEEHRVFTPPKLSASACILPGPAGQVDAFTSASVRAWTESTRRPAWHCKTDKLVIFDGFERQQNGELKARTRTSKGLTIARRRGDTEMIVIPMDCTHCQEMLNRHEWKYPIQVCKRNVCWECKERCKWEEEQAMIAIAEQKELRVEGNRQRADSVLEEDEVKEEDMMHKIGIEQARPKSPIEVVGGIAERLGVDS